VVAARVYAVIAALEGSDYFEDLKLADLDANGARVERKEFFRCSFTGCKLAESTWERCAFEACVFDDCDLTRMKPSSSYNGVVFRGCKLLGADFSRMAANPDVNFARCILRYAVFTDVSLRALSFEECELQEAQFSSCSLIDTDFTGCDLTGASFSRCDLGGADFSSSRGVYLEPRGNTLKGAFVPVDSAVLLAHAAGLLVDGYDKRPRRKKR
jgi:fluoroquinolone resistance protein